MSPTMIPKVIHLLLLSLPYQNYSVFSNEQAAQILKQWLQSRAAEEPLTNVQNPQVTKPTAAHPTVNNKLQILSICVTISNSSV